jgi:succinate dehydrogenase/fumarate reductase flavoprotein subunit
MAGSAARDIREIRRFDLETEVLVVGLGAAGAAAALEASRRGAQTLVVERAGGGGGTSAMSGGVVYLGGGTPVQRACGFDDSPDEMFKYLMASCGDAPDADKLRLYCDGSVAHYHWIVEQGVPFRHSFHAGVSGEPPTDDGLVYSGSECVHPFCELAVPAPRGHVPRGENAVGHLLMQHLVAAVEASPATLQTDTRCSALVLDREGAVVGAVTQSFGEERTIRARRGVVLTTGGFINDREMIRDHCPRVARCKVRVGAEGDDGSGIRLGISAGASTIHMDAASISLPATQPWGLKRGVLVNAQGQRFINEDVYYGRLGEWSLYRADGRAWLIVDDAIFERPEYPRDITAVAETPVELESELGLPPGSLEATLALYNRHATQRCDPVFHKHADYLQPLVVPPFAALDCSAESSIYAAFTLGGLETDVDGRVLRPAGDAIPGLWAAGRSSSGLAVGGYSSGLSLGDGTFFGRRAGRSASESQT